MEGKSIMGAAGLHQGALLLLTVVAATVNIVITVHLLVDLHMAADQEGMYLPLILPPIAGALLGAAAMAVALMFMLDNFVSACLLSSVV